ncbi:MAG: 3'-5' exonuclease, partial [Acidobacteriota bacterium]
MRVESLNIDEILYGADPTEGIVAVEPVGPKAMRLFIRRGGRVETRDEPFTPFILLEDEGALRDFKPPHRIEPLSGANALRWLALFESWTDCERARDHLRQALGDGGPGAPYLHLSDPVYQYLLLTGKTLFKGLGYSDLHRMAVDIETTVAPGFEFSNPQRESDRIISMAIGDNRGHEEVLFGREMGEREMLETLGERISRFDPDVIEGHNFFNFDLTYILARAKLHGVRLGWGRNGSPPRVRSSRFAVAERTIDYNRFDLFGRHVVDTYFLLQYYDVAARELESYGLKAAARHFGLAREDRTYVEHKDIAASFDADPEALKRYNLDDVRETLALSELLGYSFFLQARIFPFSYQNILVRGNATKINGLFLREYLRRRVSIPKPTAGETFEGGYTDVFSQGVVENVLHCDVASLYPSILLSYGIKPSGDVLDIFLPLLKNLKAFRLDAKRRAKESSAQHERDYYSALQGTFKVLINSFYGYLGTALHHFSDPRAASETARIGRDIIHRMIDWLKEEGAVPLEVDTDGIYFVPPPAVQSPREAEALVHRLTESLPEGIAVELAGRYR